MVGQIIRYLPSLLIQFLYSMYSKLQNVKILQLAVHTVQTNWISRLGKYLMGQIH